MMKVIQAIRGMHDSLPQQMPLWQHAENILRQIIASYGYQEIRMPIVESTALFQRAIGNITDIVEKEMYTFKDRNGDSLTLRPEGTAGCVRAANQAGLLYNQEQRLWYMGSMFRHERPQKGRYRQFSQFGVEVFGLAGPDIDLELIMISIAVWQALGITEYLTLQINSIGTSADRARYVSVLIKYLQKYQDGLSANEQRQLKENPLRILDSKDSKIQSLLKEAPKLSEYLDEAAKAHFQQLCQWLDEAGINYQINEQLVRGLDYYNKTVFEWVTKSLGSQGTVCAGGHYDALVQQLGGKSTSAIGFAIGVERLVLLLGEALAANHVPRKPVDIYLMVDQGVSPVFSFKQAEQWRKQLPQLRIKQHCGDSSLKKQIKRAEQSGAKLAILFTKDALAKETVIINSLPVCSENKGFQVNYNQEIITLLAKI